MTKHSNKFSNFFGITENRRYFGTQKYARHFSECFCDENCHFKNFLGREK